MSCSLRASCREGRVGEKRKQCAQSVLPSQRASHTRRQGSRAPGQGQRPEALRAQGLDEGRNGEKGEAGRGKPRHQNGYGDIPLAPQAGKHAPQALHGQRGNRRGGPPGGACRYGLPVPGPVDGVKNPGGKEFAGPRFFTHLRQQVKPDLAHQLPVAVFHSPQSLL